MCSMFPLYYTQPTVLYPDIWETSSSDIEYTGDTIACLIVARGPEHWYTRIIRLDNNYSSDPPAMHRATEKQCYDRGRVRWESWI